MAEYRGGYPLTPYMKSVLGCPIHDLTYFFEDGAKNDPPGTEYPPCPECAAEEGDEPANG